MKAMRCYACHARDGVGGVSDQRDQYFLTEDPNLGPQGRIPPTLTGVGGKLKSKWLRQVLVSGRAIRPYVKTRMPQYGTQNVSHFVELFLESDPSLETEFGHFDDEKETKKSATELVGNQGLNCIACHTFRFEPAQTMPAVDLTEMAERLRRPWFYEYMKSPQSLNPGTVMPSFWPGGKSIRPEILDGNREQQIEAIWLYLQDGRQARTPRGQRVEPIELLADSDRAVMLRRSYPNIGKRGIGVGYPSQVNLAFDAEQLRLGLLWKGKFADPGGVWRSQGHGRVRPLSREVFRFAKGPDLDDAVSPWVVDDGRPPAHQFLGYHLDDRDRPAFRYRFEDIEVEDYAVDDSSGSVEGVMLRRTVRLNAARARTGLVFRAASGDLVERSENGQFVIRPDLNVRVVGDRPSVIKKAILDIPKDATPIVGEQLLIPLDLPAGKSELVIEYEWK